MGKIGYSLYVSSFDEQKAMFERINGEGKFVFTSFHIKEEMSDEEAYTKTAKEVVNWLRDRGFKIIGDVSPLTLKVFGSQSLEHFVEELGIHYLRLDYGFSDDEVFKLAKRYPICFNASTIDADFVDKLKALGTTVYGCHNFYPRPETGLDDRLFNQLNDQIIKLGIHTMAFIPGKLKRGPIYEGLPTLERHRHVPSYVAFLDLLIKARIDTVLVGDLTIDSKDQQLIDDYLNDGVISIPVNLRPNYEHLYHRNFTIRRDSPYSNIRLSESRLMEWAEKDLLPSNTVERRMGSITLDNINYGRYQGEIQILRVDRHKDHRINVIGWVASKYLPLLPIIENGQKIRMVPGDN